MFGGVIISGGVHEDPSSGLSDTEENPERMSSPNVLPTVHCRHQPRELHQVGKH